MVLQLVFQTLLLRISREIYIQVNCRRRGEQNQRVSDYIQSKLPSDLHLISTKLRERPICARSVNINCRHYLKVVNSQDRIPRMTVLGYVPVRQSRWESKKQISVSELEASLIA